jgi:hypothetical protein
MADAGTVAAASDYLDAEEAAYAFDNAQGLADARGGRASLSLSRARTTAADEAVVLDDASVVRFSESPLAAAARASLARFAQAAAAQQQRQALDAALSPPTSPHEAAARARAVYFKHLTAELTHGANYAAVEAAAAAAAATPKDEVGQLLTEVGVGFSRAWGGLWLAEFAVEYKVQNPRLNIFFIMNKTF